MSFLLYTLFWLVVYTCYLMGPYTPIIWWVVYTPFCDGLYNSVFLWAVFTCLLMGCIHPLFDGLYTPIFYGLYTLGPFFHGLYMLAGSIFWWVVYTCILVGCIHWVHFFMGCIIRYKLSYLSIIGPLFFCFWVISLTKWYLELSKLVSSCIFGGGGMCHNPKLNGCGLLLEFYGYTY